jgi:hypothetical protein
MALYKELTPEQKRKLHLDISQGTPFYGATIGLICESINIGEYEVIASLGEDKFHLGMEAFIKLVLAISESYL